MKDELTVNFTGWDELRTKFESLDRGLRKKITQRAVRKGGKILLDHAKALVPVKTGGLKNSLKIKQKTSKDGFVKIMVGTSAGWFGGDEFYGAFQEFGWKQGHRRLGNTRKKIPGEHYVEYTFKEKATEASQAIIDELMFEVFKIMDK